MTPDDLIPRPEGDLALRRDALARRVLGDITRRIRRVLLLGRGSGAEGWMIETLEGVPGLTLVSGDAVGEEEPPGIDLIVDFEDRRGVRWRKRDQSRTPLLVVTWAHAPRVLQMLRSIFLGADADLAQVVGCHPEPGPVGPPTPEDAQRFRENVAIGVELSEVRDEAERPEARQRRGRVLWVGVPSDGLEHARGLFAAAGLDVTPVPRLWAGELLDRAEPEVDVLVAGIAAAADLFAEHAARFRTTLPWIAAGADEPFDPVAEIVDCMRNALPDAYLDLQADPNPLPAMILLRAWRVRQAMVRAAASDRLPDPA